MSHRYFLEFDDGPEQECSKDEFVKAERLCGYTNPENPREPALAGFTGYHRETRIRGRVETDYQTLIEEMEARIALDKTE